MHLKKLRDGQWHLIQLALFCMAESERGGTDLLFTHLFGSKADLSIEKAAPCELIELYKKAPGNDTAW